MVLESMVNVANNIHDFVSESIEECDTRGHTLLTTDLIDALYHFMWHGLGSPAVTKDVSSRSEAKKEMTTLQVARRTRQMMVQIHDRFKSITDGAFLSVR
jgi:hypothetical protein